LQKFALLFLTSHLYELICKTEAGAEEVESHTLQGSLPQVDAALGLF
jgi:hypothetical protein